jgi:hypothetical protein
MDDDGHQIADLRSFQTIAGKSGGIATLYFWSILDCLVELAYAISVDFFARPHMYTALTERTSADIARLRARYGMDERIPSLQQRFEIFGPIFGPTDGTVSTGASQFCQLRDALCEAVVRFRVRPAEEGVEMLRQDVRFSAGALRDWLGSHHGSSVGWSSGQALPNISEQLAYQILRAQAITAIFGINPGLDPTWPYAPSRDAEKFVEEASRQLMFSGSGLTPVNRATIARLQRVATRGAEAIAIVLQDTGDSTSDSDVSALVTASYAWLSALRSIGPSQSDSVTVLSMNTMNRTPYLGTNVVAALRN